MLEVLECLDRPAHDRVGRLVVQPRDHAHAARIVLETGVVETYGLRLCGVHAHVSARGAVLPGAHPVGAYGQAGT